MRKSAAASVFLAAALALGCAPSARAASSAWAEGEGARVRLLAAGAPDAAGRLRGLLEIALQPGWKTYWRDPGAAGVPPSLDVAASGNVSGVEILFPLPERRDEGYGAWAGYGAPVSLPLVFTLADAAAPAAVSADIFLGVCRDICVPLAAHLTLDTADGDDPEERAAVDAAFAALPGAAGKSFGLSAPRIDGDALTVDAALPQPAAAAPVLFLAGGNGYAFGVPAAQRSAAGWRFSVPVLSHPDPGTAGAEIFYTLNAGGDAVSGILDLP